MGFSLLKGLTEEKIMLFKRPRSIKLSLPLAGIIRLVDAEGNTLGIILNKETLEESRGSGRVSGDEVKKKAGL